MSDDAAYREQLAYLYARSPFYRAKLAEAGFPDAVRYCLGAIPPLHDLRQASTVVRVQTEYFSHVTQRASRPVHDYCGCDRGAFAAVFAIDVLNHLFAPVVLEVDINVGRLAALF